MDSEQAQEILKGLIDGESLEDVGASEVFNITDANNFPYEDLKEAYENDDTMVVLGNFGGMVSLRIIEIQETGGDAFEKLIKQWYDVDDKLESLELVEEDMYEAIKDYDEFLSSVLGVYVTTAPAEGGNRMRQVTMGEDSMEIGLGFGGVSFKMPKPFNFRAGLPIKKQISERLKASN